MHTQSLIHRPQLVLASLKAAAATANGTNSTAGRLVGNRLAVHAVVVFVSIWCRGPAWSVSITNANITTILTQEEEAARTAQPRTAARRCW